MTLAKFLAAIFFLELVARLVGPPDAGPYLVSLTAAEPMTELDEALSVFMFGAPDEV